MTETEKYIKDIKKFTEKIKSCPDKAIKFLLKTGVYNTDGSLSINYGGDK